MTSRLPCGIMHALRSLLGYGVTILGSCVVRCWDVQCPLSYVFLDDQTASWSVGCLKDTCDMGHWTSQHLTADDPRMVTPLDRRVTTALLNICSFVGQQSLNERANQLMTEILQACMSGLKLLNFFLEVSKEGALLEGVLNCNQKCIVVPRFFDVLVESN